jgi:conjugative transfer signal peptidase TraF
MTLAWTLGFRINVTPSLPYGLYRFTARPLPPERLASFCLESDLSSLARDRGYLAPGSCPSGLRPLLKQVVGLPGDVIGLQDGMMVLNGQVLAHTAPAVCDSKGRSVRPSRLRVGVIPPGQALMLAQRSDSFDSRYFGLVPLDRIQWVEPICTFN